MLCMLRLLVFQTLNKAMQSCRSAAVLLPDRVQVWLAERQTHPACKSQKRWVRVAHITEKATTRKLALAHDGC